MCKCLYFAFKYEYKFNLLILLIRFLYVRLLDLKDGYIQKFVKYDNVFKGVFVFIQKYDYFYG